MHKKKPRDDDLYRAVLHVLGDRGKLGESRMFTLYWATRGHEGWRHHRRRNLPCARERQLQRQLRWKAVRANVYQVRICRYESYRYGGLQMYSVPLKVITIICFTEHIYRYFSNQYCHCEHIYMCEHICNLWTICLKSGTRLKVQGFEYLRK